ncbi:hypothetical protein GQ53DRAFT_835421 [Thozetella sp. PMI_491]|nr:hypothetical protein GQ53DRAFT_835421 [Thozetella sp. PMI_491]
MVDQEACQPKYVSPSCTWVTKLILRLLTAIFSLSGAAIAGKLYTGDVYSHVVLVVNGTPFVCSLLWSILDIICIIARGGHRGIHPGANVALDLLLWLTLGGTTVTTGVLGITAEHDNTFFDSDIPRKGSSYYSQLDAAVSNGLGILTIGAILTILHFITFVIACCETKIRRRLKSQKAAAAPARYDPEMAAPPKKKRAAVPSQKKPSLLDQLSATPSEQGMAGTSKTESDPAPDHPPPPYSIS